VRNNIIVVEKGVVIFNVGRKGTAKPATLISGNLYFSANGPLEMGKEGPGDSSIIADPLFVNYSNALKPSDFALSGRSPAICKDVTIGAVDKRTGSKRSGRK
jgi:hypothetical protein